MGTRIVLPESYSPSDDEEFMNDNQLEFFRQELLTWRLNLLEDATDTKIISQKKGFKGLILLIELKWNLMLQFN